MMNKVISNTNFNKYFLWFKIFISILKTVKMNSS